MEEADGQCCFGDAAAGECQDHGSEAWVRRLPEIGGIKFKTRMTILTIMLVTLNVMIDLNICASFSVGVNIFSCVMRML